MSSPKKEFNIFSGAPLTHAANQRDQYLHLWNTNSVAQVGFDNVIWNQHQESRDNYNHYDRMKVTHDITPTTSDINLNSLGR